MSNKITVPDKITHKATITNELRNQISNDGGSDKVYLEIGVDVGYTLISLSPSFGTLYGIDINQHKLSVVKNNLQKFGVNNVAGLHQGTIHNYEKFHADVVFHDASHTYDDVFQDITMILKLNLAQNFILYVHDYGLKGAGVKRAVHQHFGNNVELCGMESGWGWGRDEGYEAVKIIVNNSACGS